MSEYEKQALDFLKKNNISFKQLDVDAGYPDWDNGSMHYCHKVRFSNKNTGKSMIVNFWGSVMDFMDGKDTATPYDVLACLQKYDVGSITEFMCDFGYEIHSYSDAKRLEKTYKAVCREYKAVCRVFGDCMEELQEIA